MTSVLGVSVGASAVRFACRDAESPHGPIFRSRSVTATLERPGDPTAESLETVLTETDEIDEVDAIGVAYRNQAQAGAVQAAMTRLEIGNFHLVPEVTAALEMLETSGELGDHETLVFYDLGSSGLTVTVVDRTTGMVLSTARSDQISGDLVDRLIYDHHLALHRFSQPDDTAAQLALAARCRDAKEQLSTKGAVCMPGDGGLLLLSQDNFDSLIDSPVKASARLTREVIRRSGRTPDAAVLIGGGANIPLVTSVMESWLELPVIVPAQPELVAAEGAALLARPATGAVVLPTEATAPPETSDTVDTRHTVDTTAPSRKRRRLLLAGSVVTAVAAIGLGTALLQGSDADPTVTQESTQAPARQAVLPQPTKIPAVAPPPGSTPPVAGTQPPATSQSDGRTVDQPQTQSTTQAPFTPQTQNSAPADASAPAPPPEPAPLVPGLPQFQLPTLPPPPPPLPLPELPRIPGL